MISQALPGVFDVHPIFDIKEAISGARAGPLHLLARLRNLLAMSREQSSKTG
jgi:hypothetical protein